MNSRLFNIIFSSQSLLLLPLFWLGLRSVISPAHVDELYLLFSELGIAERGDDDRRPTAIPGSLC